MLRGKVHRATVTACYLQYEGSLTLDSALMEAAGFVPFEQVKVYNVTNGERFETYLIEGDRGSGVVCLNGAAARKGQVGDKVIIAAYGLAEEGELSGYRPRMVKVDGQNRIVKD